MAEEEVLRADRIRSYVCLPVQMWGQVLGAFNLASETPNTFLPEDIGLLMQIADHISAAVWNALLYEVEQTRRKTADALIQMAKIVNSTLELDEVLKLALEQLGSVIDYDTASILLLDGPDLIVKACRGFQQPDLLVDQSINLTPNNVAYHTIQAQEVRVEADVQQLAEWDKHRTDIEGAQTIHAWIGAPLVVRGERIGILVLDSFIPAYFTDENGETAAAFADHIALAIHNARLFEDAEEQRNKLAAILTDTTDVVLVLDTNSHIWLLNPAAERLLKLRHTQVVGSPVSDLGLPELTQALAEALASEQPTTSEITALDGSVFNASIAPVHEVGWVITMQDITPLKELDRLRTEWVAAVSHDLKNPIQLVQLGATLLEMDGPLNDAQLERVAIIQRSAEQLSDLVASVLDLARLEAGPSLRLDLLNPLEPISAALSEIEHLAAKKDQILTRDVPHDLPQIMGDRALLQRALANLLGNAVKYTTFGGEITLRAESREQHLLLDVIDTGQGIPEDALPHLFDRFYRVPGTKAKGSGLGLSIVKSIVEKHGGEIEVQSAEGKGSTFTLILPLGTS
ncbi:MAG: GAF domain-containing protein [Chloroflexi bacterium]|nr:GAF domain-containing protein [Chloroflexota bacterium]